MTSEGAVSVTPDGMVLYCNKRFAEMTRTDMTIVLVEENPVHALLVADRAVRMYKGLVERPEVTA